MQPDKAIPLPQKKAPAMTEAKGKASYGAIPARSYQTTAHCEPPEELASLPGWLVWKYEHEENREKPRKVPYYVNGSRRRGIQGRPEDCQNLVIYDEAIKAAARGFDGVGFALMPEFGVVALDFDNCVTDGLVNPAVEDLVSCTYAEYSPSGNGVRAFFKGNLGNRKDHTPDPYGFETFSTKGFVTFTGQPLDCTALLGTGDTIATVSSDVRALCAARFSHDTKANDSQGVDPLMDYEPSLGLSTEQIREHLDVLDPNMGHDDWLHVGMAIHHETSGQGFDLWDEWSAGGASYPGAETLAKRWDSFGNATRPVTARFLVKLAHDYRPVPNPQGYTLDELRPIEHTIDGFLASGVTVIAGAPGVGKTSLLVPLACSVAHLCPDGAALKPELRRHVVYVSEDSGQVQRVLYGIKAHYVPEKAGEFPTWFHIIQAVRSKPVALARAITQWRESYTYTAGPEQNGYQIEPLIVFDTSNATLDLDNENDNAEAGKAIAAIKQALGNASLWIVTHVSKVNSREDVQNLSARGAGAFEGDANAVAYILNDEAIGECRYMVLGKRRFEPKFTELVFESHSDFRDVHTDWGTTQRVWYRYGEPTIPGMTRAEMKRAIQVQKLEAAKVECKSRIVALVESAQSSGQVVNKTTLRENSGAKAAFASVVIDELVRDGHIESVKNSGKPGATYIIGRTPWLPDEPLAVLGTEGNEG